MNTIANLYISILSIFLLSLPVKATHIAPTTYRDKVLSELSDNSSKFSKLVEIDIKKTLAILDYFIEKMVFGDKPEQKKEIFSKTKIFLNTGNISCVIKYLQKMELRELSDNQVFKKLMIILSGLEEKSIPLVFPVGYSNQSIQFRTLISSNEITYKDVKIMIAAQIQSEEPNINDRKYIYQSPSVLMTTRLGKLVSDDTHFLARASGNTNSARYIVKTPVIDENNLEEGIKDIAYLYNKCSDSYTLNHALYVLYSSVTPGTSVETVFNHMCAFNDTAAQYHTAKEWLSFILFSNINEAESKYLESMIINQNELEQKLTNELASILSKDDKKLAHLLRSNEWDSITISIPLSGYHVREKYSLELNFGTILDLAFKTNAPVVKKLPTSKNTPLSFAVKQIKQDVASDNSLPQHLPEVAPIDEKPASAGALAHKESSNLAPKSVRSGKVEFVISQFDPKERELIHTSFILDIENIPYTTSREEFIQHVLSFFIAEKQKIVPVNVYLGEKKCTASPHVKGQIPDKLSRFFCKFLLNGGLEEFLSAAHFTDDNNSIVEWENISQIDNHLFFLKTQYIVPRNLPVKFYEKSREILDTIIQFDPSLNNLYTQILELAKNYNIENIISIGKNGEESDILQEVMANHLKKVPLMNETNNSCGLHIIVTDANLPKN